MHNLKEFFQIAQAQGEMSQLKDEIERLRRENAAFQQTITDLQKEVAALKEKFNTSSNNSSTAPSQDPYRQKKPKKCSGRKSGGQPGHHGHSRKLFPPEQVQKNVDVYPETCPNCGTGTFEPDPIKTHIQQTVELPEIKPEVTQFNFHTCRCKKCGKHVAPQVPSEAKKGFGPRLMGFIEILTGEARATKRITITVLGYLGILISSGSVSNIHKLAADVLKGPYEMIKAAVLNQHMNADETSWYRNGKRKWCWTGTASNATFFQIDASRSMAACKRVFGDFKNVLTADRYGAYNILDCEKQSCWSHLDRDFEKIEGRGDADEVVGRALKAVADLVFKEWRAFVAGILTREELQKKFESEMIPSMKSILTVGALGQGVSSKTQATCLNILLRLETLWTFIYKEGVEPTNNRAERDLRPLVICRKLTAGSRSEWGEKHIERLMSVVATLKKGTKNIFEYLTSCFWARQRAGPIPSPF